MYNFEKRVVIHQSGVPNSDKYCLVMLEDGTMQKAFYDEGEWVFCNDNLPEKIKAWFYIEGIFDTQESADIRMYIDESERCI